jgi:predicted permease
MELYEGVFRMKNPDIVIPVIIISYILMATFLGWLWIKKQRKKDKSKKLKGYIEIE